MNRKTSIAAAAFICVSPATYAATKCTVTATAYVETTDGFAIGSLARAAKSSTGKIAAVEVFIEESTGSTANQSTASIGSEFCPIGPMTQAVACPPARGASITIDTQGNIASLTCNDGSVPVQLVIPANTLPWANPLPLPLPPAARFPSAPGNFYEVSPLKSKWTASFLPQKPGSYNASFHIYCVEGYCANGEAGGVITNGSVILSAGPYFTTLRETAGAPIKNNP